MIPEDRLMKYATAFARDDLDHTIGPEYPLPDTDHDFWRTWKRTAAIAINLADEEHPPPPNSTVKKLPDDILALIVRLPYLSTACGNARALQSAIVRHPDRAADLAMWRDIKHGECRQNNKHDDMKCICGCHVDGVT